MKEQVIAYIIEIVKDITKTKVELNKDTDIFKDTGMDSLDAIELISKLEEKYNITVPDTEISDIHTVEDAADIVCKYVK